MKILKVIPRQSIGKIKIGMNREEVYSILGMPKKQETIEWIGDYHIEYDNDKMKWFFVESVLQRAFFLVLLYLPGCIKT